MKTNRMIIAILVCIFILINSSFVFAVSNLLPISFTQAGIDIATDKVIVSGSVTGARKGSILTLIVLKPGADKDNINVTDIIHQSQATLSNTSTFEFTPFSMLVDAPTGEYSIIVTGQTTRGIGEKTTTFRYTGFKEAYDSLVAIENAEATNIGTQINSAADYLLIDKALYNNLSDGSKNYIGDKISNYSLSMNSCADYASNPDSLMLLRQKIVDFRLYYNNLITIAQFKDAENAEQVNSWLNNYTNKFQYGQSGYIIDYDFDGQQGITTSDKNELTKRNIIYSYYNSNLSTEQKNIVLDILSKKNELNSVNEIREEFYTQILLTAIRFQPWTFAKEILNKEELKSIFNLNYSNFNLISETNKDKVYQNIAGYEYLSLQGSNSIKVAFESVAKDILNEQNAIKKEISSPNEGGGRGGTVSFTPSYKSEDNNSNLPNNDNGEQNGASNSIFSDISNVQWANEAINELSKKGVINGKAEGVFAPNDAITRAEFIKILVRAFRLEDINANTDMPDVEKDKWYYRYIASAQKRGIIAGRFDGSFGVNDAITRQDMVVILSRVTSIIGIILPQSNQSINFSDFGAISDYASQAVKEFSSAGVVNGITKDTFMPRDTATRAQAARLIYSLLKMVK